MPELSTAIFIGLSTIDVCYEIESLPIRNRKAKADRNWITVGGPALNAALSYARLGGNAVFLTAASHEGLGLMIDEAADRANLSVHRMAVDKRYLPVASVIIHPSNGDRTVLSWSSNDIRLIDRLPSLPGDPLFVFWDGYYPALFDRIKSEYPFVPSVFDGGSWKEHAAERLDGFTWPIVSERFFDDPAAQDWLENARLENGNLIVTRGKDPVFVKCASAGDFEVQVPQVFTVDTLGSGDVFHGAFCFARFHEGRDTRSSVFFANCVAALSCKSRSPHEWTRDEAIQMYERWLDS